MPKKNKLLIVESPTKARTIGRFLDSSYDVESCMGHIRDLPESAKDIPEKYKGKFWKNLGVNVEEDYSPIYCTPSSKTKVLKTLKDKLKKADELILATDEDREGESISWHLYEVLKPKVPVKRIVFHEITKEAVAHALKNHRQIDMSLVQAQEARRVLDRLVGYCISPLLWRKIKSRLSAGRVQSVAVRLVCDREKQRLDFVTASYFTLEGEFSKLKKAQKKSQVAQKSSQTKSFSATLFSWKSKKIASGGDFDSFGKLKNKRLFHLKKDQAQALLEKLKNAEWEVESLEKKTVSLSPRPPFITSTLQQAASARLGFSPRKSMSVAQKLYEKGLITYMRTDSTHLSQEGLNGIKKAVINFYGAQELNRTTRIYKTQAKGAQEAHEAIRPAGRTFKSPKESGLSGEELSVYRLIYNRTLACQMKNCEQERASLKIQAHEVLFACSGSRIVSPGFYRVYKEGGDEDRLLPPLKKGDKLQALKLVSQGKQTLPPARYNEASLIQKLEKEGIGRPSTYAPIITTIQDRDYVKKKNKALAPTFIALAVTRLLKENLPDYVDTGFSSKMEESLDNMASAKPSRKAYINYLSGIYEGPSGLKRKINRQEMTIDGSKSRTMHFEPFKGVSFHVGRFGAYITKKQGGKELKASLPMDVFLSDLTMKKLEEILEPDTKKERLLGQDPEGKGKILIKFGPYGPYVEREEDKKRTSIPRFLSPESLSFSQALHLLELPKFLGRHPKTKKDIIKSIGRFGPYVRHDKDFRSVKNDESFFSLDLKLALKILSEEKRISRRLGFKKPLREFKYQGNPLLILEGYSPFIKYRGKNYSFPESLDPLKISLKEAIEVISSKAKNPDNKKRTQKKRTLARSSQTKKTSSRKKRTKKS